MSIAPYTPTPFTVPVANPAVGGAGVPYPYVSVSQFQSSPTDIDTSELLPLGGDMEAQSRALADVLEQASAWADRICFGADPAAKGASLCASLSVESARVPIINGTLRLVCDYKPILQVNGVDIGSDMGSLSSVGDVIAQRLQIGRRTVYVPLYAAVRRSSDTAPGLSPSAYFPASMGGSPRVMAVWSYVNGYPHTLLAADIVAGSSTCTVRPTDGGTGLLGIIPGVTQLRIVDGVNSESFVVASVTGTTLTSATPFQYAHTLPASPDSVPVTALPADISRAVIFLASALIKTRGDNSLALAEITEPRQIQRQSGGQFEDVHQAMRLLNPFKIRVKAKN